ncbi:hypothetical protein [Bacillus sp. USDA818B3_A]|uniref:hypothetical protein n=1 Tax=Bacillus sp. USDA818B3_A TaxID=2698834 RepID=UPI001368E27E|nr:hypothetical protein [Bacillus sp. USDA818B3_A]
MDYYSESEKNMEDVNDQEEIDRNYPRPEAEKELDERGSRQRFKENKRKTKGKKGGLGVSLPFKLGSSKTKKKVEMFWVKLVFKILVIGAVFYNFRYLLNYMNDPISDFKHTLIVFGMCGGINFIAVWILFYKNSHVRFYLSLFAILGSIAYYAYVNYTNQSFLGNNIIPSVLVALSLLMFINPKVNYYFKSIVLMLIPIVGIYFSGNTFALVWALMFNAGLILFFRVHKSKSNKKDEQSRNKTQSA